MSINPTYHNWDSLKLTESHLQQFGGTSCRDAPTSRSVCILRVDTRAPVPGWLEPQTPNWATQVQIPGQPATPFFPLSLSLTHPTYTVELNLHYRIKLYMYVMRMWSTCREISLKSNMWHFQVSVWLKYSFGEVHFAENSTWISSIFTAIEGYSKQ